MANYKIGQKVITKEFGEVLISKVSEKGEILEVQKFEPGQLEPIYVRIDDLMDKTVTVISFIKSLWLQIKEFWNKTFKK